MMEDEEGEDEMAGSEEGINYNEENEEGSQNIEANQII